MAILLSSYLLIMVETVLQTRKKKAIVVFSVHNSKNTD